MNAENDFKCGPPSIPTTNHFTNHLRVVLVRHVFAAKSSFLLLSEESIIHENNEVIIIMIISGENTHTQNGYSFMRHFKWISKPCFCKALFQTPYTKENLFCHTDRPRGLI